ncbi:MAG: phosphate acyltransferase, partial [Dongiaceae bacterium]
KPFDPRLILTIAPAVAKAAMESGVAMRPITDWPAYHQQLNQFVFRSGQLMQPIFERAAETPQRIVFAEGEDERVLRAVQVMVDEGLGHPILIGRPNVVERRLAKAGLRLRPVSDFILVNPEDDPRFPDYWSMYHRLMERRGVSPQHARTVVRTRNTVIAALMVKRGEAEAMICGSSGRYGSHLTDILDVIGLSHDVHVASSLNAMITPKGTFFLCDTYVTPDPTAHEIAEMTLQAAEIVRRFGLPPKVALLSHSSFGSYDTPSARKMREALSLLALRAPELEVEGEMHGDAALNEEIRSRIFPHSKLKGSANLLIMPNIDAANISYNLMKVLGEGLSIGPILIGTALPAHILTPSITVRGIINMAAIAAVEAQALAKRQESKITMLSERILKGTNNN